MSLRHPVPTWKVLEYCEIIISHNWKGIYVTTKAKDIAEDKGTSEDILRSPAKRLPVSLDRGHQASFPLEGSTLLEEASPKSRVSALEQRVGAIYVILSALRETRVIDLLAPQWQNARRVRWNPVFPHTTRFHLQNLE